MEYINFVRNVARWEQGLSMGALVPVLGAIPAAVKIFLGLLQTIIGFLVALITLLPSLVSETARTYFCRGASHFVNGIGNVIAGGFEAIPLIGTGISLYRLKRGFTSSDASDPPDHTGQEHAIVVGYQDMEDDPIDDNGNDWTISPLFSV